MKEVGIVKDRNDDSIVVNTYGPSDGMISIVEVRNNGNDEVIDLDPDKAKALAELLIEATKTK